MKMISGYNSKKYLERRGVVEKQKNEDCKNRKRFIPGTTGGFDWSQQADYQYDRGRKV